MRRFGVLAIAVLSARLVAGQTPPAFEVASVKVDKSGDFRKQIGPAPGGRFLATNNTLRDLIPYAYALPQAQAGFRIVGGPKWIDEDRAVCRSCRHRSHRTDRTLRFRVDLGA